MKHIPKILSLAILSFINSYAQSDYELRSDSLINALRQAKDDTNKVRLLYNMSRHFNEPDDCMKYSHQCMELAKKLNWEKGLSLAGSALGWNYHMKKLNSDTAITFLLPALAIAQKISDDTIIARTNLTLEGAYRRKANYPKAIEYGKVALEYAEKTGDYMDIRYSLNTLGTIYNNIGNIDKALTYYEKALDHARNNADKSGEAAGLNNIAGIYRQQGNVDEALQYYLKSVALNKEFSANNLPADLFSIASIYEQKGDQLLALHYLFEALRLNEESGRSTWASTNSSHIGAIYIKLARENISKNELRKNTELGNEAEHVLQLIPNERNAKIQVGKRYLHSAASLQKGHGMVDELAFTYIQLSRADSLSGDYLSALKNYQLAIRYRDSVFNQEGAERIARMEIQSEYEKQMLADSLKNARTQELAEQKLSRQRRYTFTGVGGILLLIFIAFFIAKERRKSDKLLLNILPIEVAKELKTKGESDARLFDNVTVLFTDFVDFTKVSERLNPQELVHELDECFKAFDGIIEQFEMEKIKTIGDAYLAVCGMPTADKQHAEKVVRAAQNIRNFMLQRHKQLGDRTFEIRIGVHSGEVVAGIVGVKKFAYDIWGDTVNTAARMEQNSEAGKINISQTTYELVRDKFTCTYRGELEAKNKGKLKMYFVDEQVG
ncbi:MAG: tetratricopeptide repeat protein [Chitinophagaceae bacterium]|nr:tetratricopeptide repeat protein [Chitinophagaceae bacterium]MCB9044965.1 tetratricopeptide repeat protein [Chitinophagales bacterium]